MHLNWSTFILEIINFLVLVWILQRIFYLPIKNAIENRKKTIQQSLSDAKQIQHEAEDLKLQYQNRLIEWEKEKEQKNASLQQEIAKKQSEALEDLKAEIAKEREKNKFQDKQKLEERITKIEQQTFTNAAKFAAKLLTKFASPQLEEQIIQLFLEQLPLIPAEKANLIKNEIAKDNNKTIMVSSAFVLSSKLQEVITATLKKQFASDVAVSFKIEPKILAGLYLVIGSMIIHANLRDELKFFSEIPLHE
ncbi:MAG: F0F1 ATP synthase subunit delta [Gammaproteobacteria bacterium]|nr:F0F1 ATP synthase subunit delta [Gammaproteobacteria bacterium]